MARADKPFWFVRALSTWQGGVAFWVLFIALMVGLDWHKCERIRVDDSPVGTWDYTLGDVERCAASWWKPSGTKE